MKNSARVLMIGLDAAEPRLVERWIKDGTLPNLKRLFAKGVFGRLASTADWLAGSPWPTFYTGTLPADHGLYHTPQWRADQMLHLRPSPAWLPLRPFWLDLSERGHRVIVIDLPMKFAPEPFNGVEIYGWATHDRLASPTSYPTSMVDWVRREYGPPLGDEPWGPQRIKSSFQLRDELVKATSRTADVAKVLMRREPWDLFMVGFGATHRGGHKLWDVSGLLGNVRPRDRARFSQALRDVYVACDAAVGQLVEAAGDGVTILVFSLHGMGPNTSRVCLLPTMLDRILNKEAKSGRSPLRRRLIEAIPPELRYGHNLIRLLPSSLRLRARPSVDWARTPVVSLVADLQGYIRINLCDREAAGIVKPGQEFDKLCADITEGLRTFVDADTGKPVVDKVTRCDQLFTEGVRRNCLPDLIVRWASSPAANHRAIVSPRYGSISWPISGCNPDGRSGNHRSEGFLLAVGEGIRTGSQIKGAHIIDLAPTVCALLGVPKPAEMHGNAISAIL